MTVLERLQEDVKKAMKARASIHVTTYRMAIDLIKKKMIDLRRDLTDQEQEAILVSMIKQRKDSMQQFEAAGRNDLATDELIEIGLLKQFLPQEASDEQIRQVVESITTSYRSEVGRDLTKKDIGAITKGSQAAIALAGFRADGKILNSFVQAALVTN